MRISQRGREVSRLEAFSDAVFAFSATLLVVSLEVPQTVPELVADLSGFAAFALSFGALMLIWTVHNAFFRRYGLQDRVTVLLNSVLLFVVLFYVYPLKFVSRGFVASYTGIGEFNVATLEELGLLFALYSGGFAALFACVAGMYANAWRLREVLGLDAAERHEAATHARTYAIFVAVGLLSVALALTGVGLGWALPGLVYWLLGPLCWVHGWWSERRGALAATPASAR